VKVSIILEEIGLPWVRNLIGYEARALVGFDDFRHVPRVLDAFVARPAVVLRLAIPSGGVRPS
jgi:GST-like protein